MIGQSEFRTLFIRRRNVLHAVVSVLISEQTQLWHRWDTNRAIESYYAELKPLDIADSSGVIPARRRRPRELRPDSPGPCTNRLLGALPRWVLGVVLARAAEPEDVDRGCDGRPQEDRGDHHHVDARLATRSQDPNHQIEGSWSRSGRVTKWSARGAVVTRPALERPARHGLRRTRSRAGPFPGSRPRSRSPGAGARSPRSSRPPGSHSTPC